MQGGRALVGIVRTDDQGFRQFSRGARKLREDQHASLIVAGRVPDRVAAAMSFHGGGLAADDPGSPHLLAEQITARVYVGGARDDASFTVADSLILEAALTAAGVDHTIEFYSAAHGFAVPDNLPYDEAAARQHWEAMAQVFGSTLR